MVKTAFTKKYRRIEKKLITEAVIKYQEEMVRIKNAMWDTGANITCISKTVCDRLQLIPIGEAIVLTPLGESIVEKYLVDIELSKGFTVTDVEVLSTEIGQQGLDLLIGMDIISLGDFSISNFNGKTQFSYRCPSREHIDYTDKTV